MKKIGYTDNGNVMLECSHKELELLKYLAEVATGKTLPVAVYPTELRLEGDFVPAFEAICEWIIVKDRANALRHQADEIDHAIGVKAGDK